MLTLGAGSCFRVVLRRAELAVIACLVVALSACSGIASSDGVATSQQAIVYGEDDRREYYQVEDPGRQALFRESVVVIAPRELAESLAARGGAGAAGANAGASVLPTWGEVMNLCPGEPFAEQPAVGFCTGVLVDWDLVLTAGHCASVSSPDQFRVVFGDYYVEAGRLALRAGDVYAPSEIVTTVHEVPGDGTRIDYAWIRLARPARPPHRPSAIHTRALALAERAPLLVISAGGGVPLKLDAGGEVTDPRSERLDHFVADTDTSQGSSGAAAFAADLAVIGVLSTGQPDFVTTSAGCLTTRREPDPAQAREQYTYAARAVEGLCAVTDSPLCDPSCAEPCRVPELALVPDPDASGCSIRGVGGGRKLVPLLEGWAGAVICGVCLLFVAGFRRRGLPRPWR
jgi:hypothetical protein